MQQSVSADSAVPGSPVTIADKVFEQIVRAIVEGEIAAGSKISEPELARAYGISRGPLREALSRLEACRLIVRKPNVGARVIVLNTTELLELYLVREALEGMACRLAAEHMSQGEIDELRRLLEAHMQNADLQEGRAYFQKEGDLDFHYRIVQGSNNAKLIGLLCHDLYHLVRFYRYQFGMPSPRARRAFSEHSQIIDAIEDGDGELAEILMRRHIRASRQNIEKRLQSDPPADAARLADSARPAGPRNDHRGLAQ
ncbi:GntR family transcriptional regulator [Exilibacterium tricleocarpae]|uniref:GntR family transcriptional regulator n=1 Tax=Exilibacterium tricleocarpae TaxID=2591008 RepID=A0A545TVV1_9GAMM|nr:GntR family transcriptional regulator [Exilibacterium tricleocarpae]TQV81334.1 GntR family transcriptional regulator [Exilibacterium tricleocarpae]